MTTTQKVLVTGATGFLGGSIITAFEGNPDFELVAACRDPSKLPAHFKGEVREGNLRDPDYRRRLVKGIDIICHAGTWASMWGHHREEKTNFFNPTRQLIDAAINAGVKRFILSGTVAMARRSNRLIDDSAPAGKRRFWPHLNHLIDIDRIMQQRAHEGMQMVTLRPGHFIGPGNRLGLLPVLLPRLKTRLVPWLRGGQSRMPLITAHDLGRAFVCSASSDRLDNYESINICGNTFPTTREVITCISELTGIPQPWFSVPYPAAYLFAWITETLYPLTGANAPFLTGSVVHLAENWHCDTRKARDRIGFESKDNWLDAVKDAVEELQKADIPWPAMAQK